MLRNIIVATGGFGDRLNGYKNDLKNKGLIKDERGITLLEHTLRCIKRSNVADRLILATRQDIREIVEKIADSVGVNYIVIEHDGLIGVRSLPVLCKQELNGERFGLICGHAPFIPKHLQEMFLLSKDNKDEVVSLYISRNGLSEKTAKAKVMDHYNLSRIINGEDDSEDHSFYIESPFILNSEIIDLIEKDNCSGSD